MLKVGDKIRITYMQGEPQYTGRTGEVTSIREDPWDGICYRGTWGGCSLYPKTDSYELL